MTLLLLDAPCFKREPGDCVAMVGYDFPIPEGDVSKATVESSRVEPVHQKWRAPLGTAAKKK